MDALAKLRRNWHFRHLQKRLSEQPVLHRSVSFPAAKEIGILFEGLELKQREPVVAFAEKLKKQGKTVKLLAFMDNRVENEGFFFKNFNRKDLNWALVPQGEEVEDFIRRPFDILINFSLSNNLSLEYIAACSAAKFRVGPLTSHTHCYELMIDLPSGKDLAAFIEQVEFYLHKMQPTNEATAV